MKFLKAWAKGILALLIFCLICAGFYAFVAWPSWVWSSGWYEGVWVVFILTAVAGSLFYKDESNGQ